MNYYFPIRNDAELRVYKFVDQNDEENKEYWLIESDPKARTLVLKKNNSDHQLHSAYFVQVNTESVNLIEYSHYKISENMSTKLRTRSINENDVFSNKPKLCKYAYEYIDSIGTKSIENIRSFENFEKIKFKNKNYKAAKFNDQYTITIKEKSDVYKIQQYSYFAQNIGLVKYERLIEENKTEMMKLEEIMTYDQYKIMRRKNLRNKN